MSQVIQKGPVCDNEEVLQKQRDIVICRCEEITLGEIQDWIAKGYDTFDELKRVLRVGMGPCQGRMCGTTVAALIAEARGISIEEAGALRPRAHHTAVGALAQR